MKLVGNGWAAAGMLRVLETMKNSDSNSAFKDQQANLTMWVQEIVNGTWSYQVYIAVWWTQALPKALLS